MLQASQLLAQSESGVVMFTMVDATDFNTLETGVTVTVTMSKNGSVFATPGGSVVEISNGWYKLLLKTTDTNTLGPLAFYCTGTGCMPRTFQCFVVRAALLDPITNIQNTLDIYGLNLLGEDVRRGRSGK